MSEEVIEESVAELLLEAGIPPVPVEVGGEAGLPSVYRVEALAGTAVGGATAAAARLWELRGGP
ncbi:hypothetical protein, partial [Actinocorallia lasiicapitis]